MREGVLDELFRSIGFGGWISIGAILISAFTLASRLRGEYWEGVRKQRDDYRQENTELRAEIRRKDRIIDRISGERDERGDRQDRNDD